MNYSAVLKDQFRSIISRIAIFLILLFALAVGSPSAQAQQTVTGHFTCDNGYAVWVGNSLAVGIPGYTTSVVEGINSEFTDITSGEYVSFDVEDDFEDCYLYLIAWSDDKAYQGILGSFSGAVTLGTGDPRWQVLHMDNTNDDIDTPNYVYPYGTSITPPDDGQINGKIQTANGNATIAMANGGTCNNGIWSSSSVGAAGSPCWTDPYLGSTNGSPIFPFDIFGTLADISSNAKWMWYDSTRGQDTSTRRLSENGRKTN